MKIEQANEKNKDYIVKEPFVEPDIEIVLFSSGDILTISCGLTSDNNGADNVFDW